MSLKTVRNAILIIALVILAFGAGFQAGAGGLSQERVLVSSDIKGKTAVKSAVDFSLFWDVWDRLGRFYLDKKALDPQKQVYGAISGMVSSLGDPYTVFLPPEQNKEAKDDLGGKFEGIGAQLGVKDKKIVVIAPLKGTPAESAGLKPGDWIVKVDGLETISWTLPYAVSKIRGSKGSKVILTILQENAVKPSDVTVERDAIKVSSVEWEVKKFKIQNSKFKIIGEQCEDCEKIIYLKLSRFGDNTTDEWNKAIDQVEQYLNAKDISMKGMVFDLRNNPGGYLSGSVFIASEFLSDGVVVIQESTDSRQQVYKVNRKGRLLTIPMVVLINKGSASASEIVAGALRERGRAKLIGETSFGKGSIQEVQELSSGSGLHITTAKWLLPSQKWINGQGLSPDVIIANDEAKPEVDLQLEKAIEVLLQ